MVHRRTAILSRTRLRLVSLDGFLRISSPSYPVFFLHPLKKLLIFRALKELLPRIRSLFPIFIRRCISDNFRLEIGIPSIKVIRLALEQNQVRNIHWLRGVNACLKVLAKSPRESLGALIPEAVLPDPDFPRLGIGFVNLHRLVQALSYSQVQRGWLLGLL